MKYGRVAILGRASVGKSTLINQIMGQKVSITSPLPQTTRKNRRVLYEDKRGKIIFSDTPGMVDKVVDLVAKQANLQAPKELGWADLLVVMVDISREKSQEENRVLGLARKRQVPKILVYNKIDQAVDSKNHLAEYNFWEDEFEAVVSISALKNKHVAALVDKIFELLPAKADKETKKEIEVIEKSQQAKLGSGPKEFVAELIREKTYLNLRQELPYSITVEVEEIKDKDKIVVIRAKILTNKERYKKMIIGKGGRKIKDIGRAARKELETGMNRKVFLELRVEVDRHWPERQERV